MIGCKGKKMEVINMVEIQEELRLGIGSEEAQTLLPTIVSIQKVEIQELGVKKAKKVVCFCKHPNAENLIQISAVKYENKGKLDTAGLWINKDSKGLIRKGSALAVLLQNNGCKTIEDLNKATLPTTTDDKGYLVFKGY